MVTRRIQVLLDDERYEHVTSLARQRRVPVTEVIREAIDRGLGAAQCRRSAAARRILEAHDMPVPGPAQLRAELDDIRGHTGYRR